MQWRWTGGRSNLPPLETAAKALRKCLKQFELTMPRLLDYEVRIPPGGKTDALVEATITWDTKGKSLVTTGIDSDQLVAAVLATEKMLNLVVPR